MSDLAQKLRDAASKYARLRVENSHRQNGTTDQDCDNAWVAIAQLTNRVRKIEAQYEGKCVCCLGEAMGCPCCYGTGGVSSCPLNYEH